MLRSNTLSRKRGGQAGGLTFWVDGQAVAGLHAALKTKDEIARQYVPNLQRINTVTEQARL
jgi:lipoate-protein ligase B